MKELIKSSKNGLAILVVAVLVAIPLATALAIGVGSKVSNVQLRDSKDNPSWIPHLGKKVVTIFYTDPDEADQNDPASNYLKAKDYSKDNYAGIGIVNMKDAPWKPNTIIRAMVRKKEGQFPGAIFLTDPDHLLKNAWGLGNCDDKAAVLIIGKDKKVYYFKKGAVPSSEFAQMDKIINDLMKK